VPQNPEGWLLAVTRDRRHDALGSAAQRRATSLDHAAETVHDVRTDITVLIDRRDEIPDRRLELLFACAHPAIDPSIRTPLMVQTVLGFDASRVARAFDVEPSAMAQRLVRAKRKVRYAGIPFTFPSRSDMAVRTGAVLEAIYGAYSVTWLDQHDDIRTSIADEAGWLAVLAAALLRTDAEA